MDELAVRGRQKRINLTDPDERTMRTRQGFVPVYNAQAVVSPLASPGAGGTLVTAAEVIDKVNDTGRLTPMLERAEAETGVRTPLTLADAG